jgi:hypothetical protein
MLILMQQRGWYVKFSFYKVMGISHYRQVLEFQNLFEKDLHEYVIG